jgi:hypothetical protein
MVNNDLSITIINWLAFVMDTQCFFCEEWTEILNIIHTDFWFEKFHYPALWQVVVTNCYSAVQKFPAVH